MSAKNKRAAAQKSPPTPPSAISLPTDTTTAVTAEPFYKRHPKIANAIFAALCVYVAMLWLLALDQTFHWGIFGPKVPPMP